MTNLKNVRGRESPTVVEMPKDLGHMKEEVNVPSGLSNNVATVLVLLTVAAISWAGFQLSQNNAAAQAQAAIANQQNELLKQITSDVKGVQATLGRANGDVRVLRTELANTIERVDKIEHQQQYITDDVLKYLTKR